MWPVKNNKQFLQVPSEDSLSLDTSAKWRHFPLLQVPSEDSLSLTTEGTFDLEPLTVVSCCTVHHYQKKHTLTTQGGEKKKKKNQHIPQNISWRSTQLSPQHLTGQLSSQPSSHIISLALYLTEVQPYRAVTHCSRQTRFAAHIPAPPFACTSHTVNSRKTSLRLRADQQKQQHHDHPI